MSNVDPMSDTEYKSKEFVISREGYALNAVLNWFNQRGYNISPNCGLTMDEALTDLVGQVMAEAIDMERSPKIVRRINRPIQ